MMKCTKLFTLMLCMLVIFLISGCNSRGNSGGIDSSPSSIQIAVPDSLSVFIGSMQAGLVGNTAPTTSFEDAGNGIVRVKMMFDLSDSVRQDDWKLNIRPAFTPNTWWSPHLTPTDEHVVARHVFRAPVVMAAGDGKVLRIIPDVDHINQTLNIPWYLDTDAVRGVLTLGISRTKVKEHVLFVRDSGMVYPPEKLAVSFFIMAEKATDNSNIWRRPLAWMWSRWGEPLYQRGEPVNVPMEKYVDHTYTWALKNWKSAVWQSFKLNGQSVGAPVFIVNITQSPNYPGEVSEREFRSVWNQAWFSSLRSAQGLFRYARRMNRPDYRVMAQRTKDLALQFPQFDGLFPSVIGTEMETEEVHGKKLRRSKGWNTLYFGNSNRNPLNAWGSARTAPLHTLDMSWTAYQMLTWYEDLEKDKRLLAYTSRYAEKLLSLQDAAGYFPSWIDSTGQIVPTLAQSPESSVSAMFLLKLYRITKDQRYLTAGTKAMQVIARDVVPVARWEDFETYWSCSRVLDSLVGKKIARNDAFKQNTLSMFWTATAMLDLYEISGDKQYLQTGERVLDELLMYQATWQPAFIPVHTLGGFGVMNADGEWSDSRQSLFAETIIRYGKVLQREEYTQRGLAALKASFIMMYCPENPETRKQWEIVYPFFNELDYGFMMENYGHGGETNDQGLGIGEFTIYDWGNGAAAEAWNRIADHYPDLISKRP